MDRQRDTYNPNELCGFIFMCNAKTKPQCYRYRVFGLPSAKWDVLAKIKPGMKLFLFDFEVKLLYGVYEATSGGQWNLEEAAFDGRFPAQVSFRIFCHCLPLLESSFRQAIQHNYRKGTKFSQELNKQQVSNLLSVFRPLKASAPNYFRPMAHQVMEYQSRLPLPVGSYAPRSQSSPVLKPQRVRQEGLPQHDGYSPSSNTGHGNLLMRSQMGAARNLSPLVDTNENSTHASHAQPVVELQNVPHGVLTSEQAYHGATPTNMGHAYTATEPQALPETTNQYYPMQPYIVGNPAEATTTTGQYYTSGPKQPYMVGNPAGATPTTDQYHSSGHLQPYIPAPVTTTNDQYYSSGSLQPYMVGNPIGATTNTDQYYPSEPQQQPYAVGNPTEAISNPPPSQSDQSYSMELQQQYAAGYPPEAASDQYLRYWAAAHMACTGQQVDAGNGYHPQPQSQENGVTYYYPHLTTTAPNVVSTVQSQALSPGNAITTHSYPHHPYTGAPSTTQN